MAGIDLWEDTVMPDLDRDNNADSQGKEIPVTDDIFLSCIPQGMTLETIIDLTGELEHLNELVTLHLEKEGGFTTPASYFTAVQPILDLLEFEIRFRYRPGMTLRAMKLLIQDWIDKEIAECRRKNK